MNSRGGRTTAYTGDGGSAHKPIVMRPVARGWCAWCGLVQVPAAFAPRRHSYQRTICTNVPSLPTTRPYETHFGRPRSETSQRFFQRDASKAFASRKDSKRVLVSRELFESLAVAHRPRDFVQNTLCPPRTTTHPAQPEDSRHPPTLSVWNPTTARSRALLPVRHRFRCGWWPFRRPTDGNFDEDAPILDTWH
ncbi:hypothetical protein FHT70_004119 [Rhizobium sp. BK049]|nr:hypothetical protein [Rhizobium sp. BK049]